MKGEKHPLFDLSDRVALVTGGGSGLGREFCDILAEFGADVVCPDLNQEGAEETCEMIKKYGHKTLPIKVDVSDYEQVKTMFKQVADTFGRLDILVNNAGITSRGAQIHLMGINEWHKVIDVNLNGVFYCMKEGLRIMVEQKKGVIINIASILGLNGIDPALRTNAHYVTSKHGVIGLTRQGATEYAQYGIRVNAIAPGWMGATKMNVLISEDNYNTLEQMMVQKTPMKRRGYPHELKGLLLYLASDSSSFTTGQVFIADGGWTTW